MSDATNNRFYRTRHPDRHGPGCGCVGYGARDAEIERLTALADRLAGRLARVEALADAAESAAHLYGDSYGAVVSTDDLRAALGCGHPNHGNPDHDCAPFTEQDAHGPDWSDSLPGEPPSCRCGYNGTPEECAASRSYAASECPSRCGWNDPCPDPWHDRRIIPPEGGIDAYEAGRASIRAEA